MTTWIAVNNRLGLGTPGTAGTNFTSTDTTPLFPIGTIIDVYDQTLGGAEFIYLYGVASTIVGSVVSYDVSGGKTTLITQSIQGGPVAVALAANTSTTAAAWYQISGPAVLAKTAVKVSPSVPLYVSGTAGQVMSTVATGKVVLGCRSTNAATVLSATGTVNAILDRPHVQLTT